MNSQEVNMPIAVWVIIGIIVILLIVLWVTYNSLVGSRNWMKNAWARIDVLLKRRHDLVPNLVETVKGYRDYERSTLEAVVNARNLAQAGVSAGPAERARLEGQLSGALARLLAVVENYPDLKASQNFLALQAQLAETENGISFARQAYNDSVLSLNNKIQMFPSSIVASMTRFKAGEFFEVKAAEEKQPVQVEFS
jgi:LemA protein